MADCDSDSYRIAEYIDHFSGPIATKHLSYIKDTTHFLQTISNYKTEPHHLLITLDVDSLYTNIHNPDGIKAVQKAFIAHPQPNRPDKQLLLLLDLSLQNNDFIFRNQWYQQISGTAMGNKFAPNYSNIFLAHWKTTALAKCPLLPTCFLRYLDDIFIIWPHSRSDFIHVFHVLNTHDRNPLLTNNQPMFWMSIFLRDQRMKIAINWIQKSTSNQRTPTDSCMQHPITPNMYFRG